MQLLATFFARFSVYERTQLSQWKRYANFWRSTDCRYFHPSVNQLPHHVPILTHSLKRYAKTYSKAFEDEGYDWLPQLVEWPTERIDQLGEELGLKVG